MTAPATVRPEDVDRSPPHDLDAELVVLGELQFADAAGRGEETAEAIRRLATGDFYGDLHRRAWTASVALIEDGRELTTIALGRALEDGGIERGVAADFLLGIADRAVTSANLLPEADRLRDLGNRRRALEAAGRLDAAARDGAPFAAAMAEHAATVESLSLALGPGSSPFICYTGPELLAAKLETPAAVLGGGLLSHGGVLVLQGEEKLGKTLLAIAMALDVSRGYGDFLGFPVERAARVLYISAEGGPPLAQERLAKIAGPDEPVPEGLHFRFPAAGPLDVNTPEGLVLMEQETRRAAADYVVLDPLAETAPSLDENDGAAFKMFCAGIRRVLRRTKAGLVLVHHTAKLGVTSRRGSARRGRGSTVLPAFADSIVTLESGDNGLREATFSLRGGADPGILLLRLNGESMRFEVEAQKAAPAPCSIDRIVPIVAEAGEDGISYAAIALQLGVAERAVRDALNRAGPAVGLEPAPRKPRQPARWRKKVTA